jgi:DNA-binding GntR family transcriptional regulator
MSPDTLPRRALYQDVADALRQRIFAGQLNPGDWLDESRLTQDLGISRTPLREAIKLLAAEGLVTMKLRRGAYVTETSEQDLRDVYHLLALLEADAAATVAQRATTAELASLKALHDQLAQASHDREAFFRLNEAFHTRVLAIANNRWRNQLVADLRKVMKLNRHHSLLRSGRLPESLAEHQAIVAALMARDPNRATRAVHNHFANGLRAAQRAVAASDPALAA